jgi:uncharacterized protein
MLTIAKLFGKSPFAPLQSHMDKVANCINMLPDLFKAVEKQDLEEIRNIAKQISKSEHEADLTKNDIRNHLPKSIFLPIDRSSIFHILSIQDAFADKAEDISVLCTFKLLSNYEEFKEEFKNFYLLNVNTFTLAKQVIKEFDSLLETTFGGAEAQKVKIMIDDLAFKEHELDKMQYHLTQKIYDKCDTMSYEIFYLWHTLIKEVGSISNLAENLGNTIRMILEIK